MNRRTGFRFLGRVGMSAIAALAALFVFSAAASAGPARYVFEICDSALPGGGTAGVTYTSGGQSADNVLVENRCAEARGGLRITRSSGQDQPVSAEAKWILPNASPPGGSMQTITATATACLYTSYVLLPGWPANCAGEQTRTFTILNPRDPGQLIGASFSCGAMDPNCAPGTVQGRNFAYTLFDPNPPRIDSLQGTLFAPAASRAATVEGHVSDLGGGIAEVSISVNGSEAAPIRHSPCKVAVVDNPSIKGLVATEPVPCPVALDLNWTLDTEAAPFREGSNSVQVCASDFSTQGDAGTTCSETRRVFVDNSCTASAVRGGRTLSAQFSRNGDDAVTVGFRRSARISGQLTNEQGRPVRSASICLRTTVLGASQNMQTLPAIQTDDDGRFSFLLPAGPSRLVEVGYRDGGNLITQKLRFRSKVRPKLRLDPKIVHNGESITLSGSLPPPGNARRVAVLQANAKGSSRWITFRRATSNAKGAFSARYRFTSTTRTTTYRFRAVVPGQAGYPWVEGYSKPVKVRVTG